MQILITGITGRIGAVLAQRLVDAGHVVRGLVWPRDRRLDRLSHLPIELQEGSLTEPADVTRAVDGVDAIYHLGAAFQGGGPFTNAEYFDINVRGAFNMLEAAAASTNRPHFFFASTDALYNKYIPDGVVEPIREDEMALEPGGTYALTKQLGEDLCRGYARNQGLPLTIFRFALTVGDAEILHFPQFYLRHWLQSYARMSSPEAADVYTQLQELSACHENALLIARDETGRSYKKHIAHANDIVAGLLAGLQNPNAVGETFQLAAPAPYTWEETIPYLAQKLNLPVVDVNLAGHLPTCYEFDLAKARRLLGFAPQYDIFRMIDEAMTL
jgi:UDP-glucose 4-epimerase